MRNELILLTVYAAIIGGIVLHATGCGTIASKIEDAVDDIQGNLEGSTSGTNEQSGSDTAPIVREREPVDPLTVPEYGEFFPDPDKVLYQFGFADGTLLTFRENHDDDFWGDYPNVGFGEIRSTDGSKRYVDINTIVRKNHYIAGLNKTPVTTLDHGKRMYWFAYPDNRKRVTIFEDGWNPLVEGAVLAAQGQLGITSHLVEVRVTVESRK